MLQKSSPFAVGFVSEMEAIMCKAVHKAAIRAGEIWKQVPVIDIQVNGQGVQELVVLPNDAVGPGGVVEGREKRSQEDACFGQMFSDSVHNFRCVAENSGQRNITGYIVGAHTKENMVGLRSKPLVADCLKQFARAQARNAMIYGNQAWQVHFQVESFGDGIAQKE